MSKLKIVGMMALITFAMGILLVGDALAGEKFKWRVVWYTVKDESTNVPGEEGRIMMIREDKGILTVLQGNKLMDGMAGLNVYYIDMNTKTRTGFGHGLMLFTDRDGDKMYWAFEGKAKGGPFSGACTIVRGTGKFEEAKGKATWSSLRVAPNQFYVDWEGEMDLPR
jgi:hypothetical protein